MANEVKLTFAGDSAKLEDSFDRVGKAADGMDRKVRDSADGFDRVGEAADTVDTRAMGFRDTMTGVQDSALGVSAIMKGNLFEGTMLLATGIGDLGSAFFNFLVPLAKSTAGLIANKAAAIGHAVASKATAVATKVWAAAQWLLNTALLANPIVLIIVAIIALIAIIVLIATKTTWFQKLWKVVWAGIMAYLNFVKDMYIKAFKLMINIGEKLIGAVKKIPGLIKKAFVGLSDIITAPWRTAFNFISRAWNNTVGKLSWSVPGWVPGIGGKGISAPKLPQFHTGGTASGAMGREFLAVLRAGERVVPGGSSTGVTTVQVAAGGGSSGDRKLGEIVQELIRKGVIKLVVLPNGRVASASG